MSDKNEHSLFFWSPSIILLLLFLLACIVGLDVKSQKEVYIPDYTYYHDLQRIAADLHQTMERHSNFMMVDYGYTSRDQDSQLFVRLANFSTPTNFVGSDEGESKKKLDPSKVRILLSYGEHAREFFPVESFFHLLYHLTEGLSSPPGSPAEKFSRFIFSNFDIFVIVMANPDGRKFLETSGNYCWRGTRNGVDLNRNFDWRYGEKGSSSNPSDEEYRGPKVFSGESVSLDFLSLFVQGQRGGTSECSSSNAMDEKYRGPKVFSGESVSYINSLLVHERPYFEHLLQFSLCLSCARKL